MIVPMKKVHVLSLASRRRKTTEELGKLGTIHVEVEAAESSRISELRGERERVLRAVRALPEAPKKIEAKRKRDGQELIDHILSLTDEAREIDDRLQRLEAEAEQVAPWEDVSADELESIERAGYRVSLYVLTGDQMNRFSAPGRHFVVHSSKDRRHVLVVSAESEQPAEGAQPAVDPQPRPSRRLSEVEAEMGEARERREEIRGELVQLAVHRPVVEAELIPVDHQIEFERVRSGMNHEGEVLWFIGWIPEPKVSALRTHASNHGWGLLLEDPSDGDEPPVLVERRGVSRLIAPIFDLINTTPGYRERDISFPFLLFLTIFFAMIISDAGYGLLLIAVAVGFIVKQKVSGKAAGPGLLLLLVMSIATVAWGAMSGVWFGHEPIAELPFFEQFIVPDIYAFAPGSIDAVIAFCFVLALIHLTIARVWNVVQELSGPHKLKAVAELGWLGVLGGMFNLALTLVVSAEQYPFLPVSLYLILGGLVAVVLFANQEGNVFRGILSGLNFTSLISTGLDGINAFADTMSYLRLFAVGLASVEIAAATNELAALAGEGLGLPASILIILFGHSLNLAMGGLSVLVHGVRLNMLEFSGALGMEWSGSDYKPFRYNT